MANFPKFEQGESPSLYDNQIEDKGNKADTDGGYEFRRDRFTRPPRRMLKTGFISLRHVDFEVLEAFYLAHLMSKPFVWIDYLRGDTPRTVRFDEFVPEYVGIGKNRMWTIKIKMSEV